MARTPDAALSDLERRVGNTIVFGTVEAVDYPKARVKVRTGPNVTAWVPWLTGRAGPDRTWHPPETGEQVVLGAPCGDLNQAVVLGTVYQNAHPAPAARETLARTVYEDGTVVEYDRERHRLSIDCVGHVEIRGRTVTIHADDRLWVDCAGVGYRITRDGGVHQRTWRPDSASSRLKQPPEIDGYRKTGTRTD